MLILDSNQAQMTPELYDMLNMETVVIVEQLDSADLMFRGVLKEQRIKIGMEIKKTPSDFMASLRDGRLTSQLPRMVNKYDIPYLIEVGEQTKINLASNKVEEKVRGGRWGESAFSFHFTNSTLCRFEASGGRIRSVRNMEHLASLIISTMKFWTKGEHQEDVFYKKRHKFLDWRTISDPMIHIYDGMGIGVKRATMLTELYPTFKDLVNADKKELMQLDGFGKATVEKIMKFAGTGL